jgi:DNA-binding transcriptional MerR regulator/methylmalonyl-CoA mutase cobalamin-binding subunit
MEDRTSRYRIGQLAARAGVSPELLRAWESRYGLLAPERSAGGFRLYSREDERRVRLMRKHLRAGIATAEAAELAREGIVTQSAMRVNGSVHSAVLGRARKTLDRAFLDYDEGAAERALDELFGAFTVEAVLRDAVYPFLRDVGRAWAENRATVGQEHFASTLIQSRLMSLARGWGTGNGPRALLACPAGERHTLGLIGFGVCLARRGWRVTYLGADTPPESILHAAAKTAPALVAVSAVRARHLRSSAEALRLIAAKHRVALAGAGAGAQLASHIGAELLDADPATAAARIAQPA